MSGKVALVGAGPGAADLLTLRAARALAEADLVLYDALVDPAVLELAPKARRFCVGKRAGRPSTNQRTIEALLVRHARSGKRVVRLKCGDPFVLGRGGEEALALAEAGVECEVIPGISSAIAAPSSVGIPVTHRGLAGGFIVLSAVPSTHYRSVLGALGPEQLTVVLLMALGSRREIATWLLERGWQSLLPAAVVIDATLPSQWRWVGTLGELATLATFDGMPLDGESRGLLVLGETVSLATHDARAAGAAESRVLEGAWPRAQGY
jgi:uroporphyrin-III C-methyltransferase